MNARQITAHPGNSPLMSTPTMVPPAMGGTLPPPPHQAPPSSDRQMLQAWLAERRNDAMTPDQICRRLVELGWDADAAATLALRSLRRSDRHPALYSGLCWGAGIAAAAAGSAAHIALSGGRQSIALATAITLLLIAAPIAIYCAVVARKVEATQPHAIWSPTRRLLFATLASTTAVVGLVRLLHYTFNAVAAAVGVHGFEFTGESVVQVLVSVSISIPLFWWSLVEWRRSNVAVRGLGQ